MKTTIHAKVVIDAPQYSGFSNIDRIPHPSEEITLSKIREKIHTGHYTLEWINAELDPTCEPTLIITI